MDKNSKPNGTLIGNILKGAVGGMGLNFVVRIETIDEAAIFFDVLKNIEDLELAGKWDDNDIIIKSGSGYIKFAFNAGKIEAFIIDAPSDEYDILTIDEFEAKFIEGGTELKSEPHPDPIDEEVCVKISENEKLKESTILTGCISASQILSSKYFKIVTNGEKLNNIILKADNMLDALNKFEANRGALPIVGEAVKCSIVENIYDNI